MKKNIAILLFMLMALIFCGCLSSPLSVPEPNDEIDIAIADKKTKIDFIGFKADINLLSISTPVEYNSHRFTNPLLRVKSTNLSNFDVWRIFQTDTALKNFGETLQTKNIAENKSNEYFGNYSTQDLEEYKTNNRYVSFVEVNKNSLQWYGVDKKFSHLFWGSLLLAEGLAFSPYWVLPNDEEKTDWQESMQGVSLALGIPLCAGGIAFYATAQKPTTSFTYAGSFDILIYDTKTKKIIHRETVEVRPPIYEFKGLYENEFYRNSTFDDSDGYFSDTDTKYIAEFFASIVKNQILKKYKELSDDLNSQE